MALQGVSLGLLTFFLIVGVFGCEEIPGAAPAAQAHSQAAFGMDSNGKPIVGTGTEFQP